MSKYIDAEKLIAEIERYKRDAAIARFDNAGENADYFQGKVDLCDDLTHIITSLQQEQPSLPSVLDEAAEDSSLKYSIKLEECGITASDSVHYRTGFKAGAEWMAGQYKTLGETEIYLEDDGGELPYTQEWLDLDTTEFAIPEGFKPGDKIIVQIRKV